MFMLWNLLIQRNITLWVLMEETLSLPLLHQAVMLGSSFLLFLSMRGWFRIECLTKTQLMHSSNRICSSSKQKRYKTEQNYKLKVLKNCVFLISFFKFYFATDDEAIFHLERETGMSISLAHLINPHDSEKEDILAALVKADNQGDRHIKNLLKNPDLYSIRVELV